MPERDLPEPPAGSPRSILLVEDDPDSADSLALLLEHWHHRVSVASQGARAIEVFRRERPQVVLLGIGRPEMAGYGVARALRREDPGALVVGLGGFGGDGSGCGPARRRLIFARIIGIDRLDLRQRRRPQPRDHRRDAQFQNS